MENLAQLLKNQRQYLLSFFGSDFYVPNAGRDLYVELLMIEFTDHPCLSDLALYVYQGNAYLVKW